VIEGSVVLIKIPFVEEDEDESRQHPSVVFNITQHATKEKQPGPIVATQKGHVFVSTSEGILLIDANMDRVLGRLEMPEKDVVSLTLGEDHYLYVAAIDSLLRILTRSDPVKVATDVVLRPEAKG
jgi:hypothetical protein